MARKKKEKIILTKEEKQLSSQLDKLAKSQIDQETKDQYITKNMLEQLIDGARQQKFLMNVEDPNVINERVPGLIAFYKNDDPYGKPYKIQIRKETNVFVPADSTTEVLLSGSEIMRFLAENGGIKYKTSEALTEYVKDKYSDLFFTRKYNYVNPWAVGEEISKWILSLNIDVDSYENTKENLEYALGEDLESSEIDGILYMNYFDSSPARFRNVDKVMDFYLGITEHSREKEYPCPDLIIVCTPGNEAKGEDVTVASFNLKTGYEAKENAWKTDSMSITRKIRKAMVDNNMTDSKMQDSDRVQNSKAYHDRINK